MPKRWSPEEEKILENNYKKMTDSEIAKILKAKSGRNITKYSIYKKRRDLKLFKDREIARRRFSINCRNCGSLFQSASPNAKYCSEACKQVVYRRRWKKHPVRMNAEITINAEKLAGKKLLELGFTDILWTRNIQKTFPFDYFARKDGHLCSIEVTISERKSISKPTKRLIQYLNMNMYVVHVNPERQEMVINRLNPDGIWFSSALKARNTMHRKSYRRNFVTVYSTFNPSLEGI